MQSAIVRLEEMAQWVRTLAICTEGWSLAPSFLIRQLTTAWDSKGSDVIFGIPRAPVLMVYTPSPTHTT